MISRTRPDSVGGGVVAEIFRGLRKSSRFSGGGGLYHKFSLISRSRPDSVGGGVVAHIFRITSPETDPIRSRKREILTHSLISRDIHESRKSDLARHVHPQQINYKKKLNFKWSRGGTCPPGPPLDPPMDSTVEPPLIRPPSESHWCGRIRGMVAREGFIICCVAPMKIIHLRHLRNRCVYCINA